MAYQLLLKTKYRVNMRRYSSPVRRLFLFFFARNFGEKLCVIFRLLVELKIPKIPLRRIENYNNDIVFQNLE